MARGEKRSAARLAAVQALYQMDVAGTGIVQIMAEFESHWMGREVEGDTYKPAEVAFFRKIVEGVLEHQGSIDREIDETLAKGWPLARIEAVMRAIFRAGAFELRYRNDVPARVVISEYVDVAGAFFERDEAGMTNAVLDSLARQRRPLEFEHGLNLSGEDDFIHRHFAPCAGTARWDCVTMRRCSRRRPDTISSSPPMPSSPACISWPMIRPATSRARRCG